LAAGIRPDPLEELTALSQTHSWTSRGGREKEERERGRNGKRRGKMNEAKEKRRGGKVKGYGEEMEVRGGKGEGG